MDQKDEIMRAHLEGEELKSVREAVEGETSLDTFAGKIHVKWAPEAAVSSLGQMPFFIEFLKTSGLFDALVEDCPLCYTSPNAPNKRDVLGTLVLSVLAGHWRYAHINAIRGDGINPALLGMSKMASEDSVRRGMKAMGETESKQWLKKHLKASYEPLLVEPWILDVDSTIKPLYGRQQDAKVGYNPTKPGRPSHVYHSYFIANIRMVADMEVQAGNQTAPSYAQPELWAFLDGLTEQQRPVFLRGDSQWGSEKAMVGAEQRKLDYVFKLKQSGKVKKLISQAFGKQDWAEAGQQWEGRQDVLQLTGWTQARRVVVLRRPMRSKPEKQAQGGGQAEVETKRVPTNDARSAGDDIPGSAV
jgi:Transposase DDE domain group 1